MKIDSLPRQARDKAYEGIGLSIFYDRMPCLCAAGACNAGGRPADSAWLAVRPGAGASCTYSEYSYRRWALPIDISNIYNIVIYIYINIASIEL